MNDTESLFRKLAEQRSWELKHRGLPDFFCWKDGKIMFVEVKRKEDSPSKHQSLVMYFLEKHGIPCFIWRPGNNFPGVKFKDTQKKYFKNEENWLNYLRS